MNASGDTQALPVSDEAPEATTSSPEAIRPPRHGWLREAALVFGFYYVYQTIRSLADHGNVRSRAYRNAGWLVDWEKSIYLFHEQTIQQAFIGAHWFIKVMNIYYGTLHFIITIGLLVWMYLKRHAAYRAIRNLLGLTTALAIIGYWSFPLAPPRLYLECDGNIPVMGPEGGLVRPACFVDTLDKFGGLWSYKTAAAKAIANQYAAMPSLHFGWSLWCGIVLWRFASHRGTKWMGLAYPALTLFAIVVTANHYFLDALGGVIILLGAVGLLRAADLRMRSRQSVADVSEEIDAVATCRDPAATSSSR
ncbi:MAG: phosphatase PAP2 family protein [Actinomycetota bacterium]|nr:phosphatase PAP2 family protein [Actinomycetota bacterium]